MILHSNAVWMLIEQFKKVVPEVRLSFIEKDGVLNILIPRTFDSLPETTRLLATTEFSTLMQGLNALDVYPAVDVNYNYLEGVAYIVE